MGLGSAKVFKVRVCCVAVEKGGRGEGCRFVQRFAGSLERVLVCGGWGV